MDITTLPVMHVGNQGILANTVLLSLHKGALLTIRTSNPLKLILYLRLFALNAKKDSTGPRIASLNIIRIGISWPILKIRETG